MGSTPDDIRDVRDALRLLGIGWRTEDALARYHALAVGSLFAVRRAHGVFAHADTSEQAPAETANLWIEHLLRAAVQVEVFPDCVPASSDDWSGLAQLWDEYIAHCCEFYSIGVRFVSESDPWSVRSAVKAAWNLEFASLGSVATIGRVCEDSAHRAALSASSGLWLDYQEFVNAATERPTDRPALWDAFISCWPVQRVQRECESVSAHLAGELSRMRARLGDQAAASAAAGATEVSTAAQMRTDVCDSDAFRPASYFGKTMQPRLRKAAGKDRKSKKVRVRIIDGTTLYHVEDARRWWPNDVPNE